MRSQENRAARALAFPQEQHSLALVSLLRVHVHIRFSLFAAWPSSARAQEANLTLLSVPPGNIAVIPCGDQLKHPLRGYELRYLFENNSLPNDGQFFLSSSGNLMTVMKSSRVGVYRCTLHNAAGSALHYSLFELRLQPSEQRSPARLVHISAQQLVANEGDNVTLECVYHGSPVPSNRWEMYERDDKRPKMISESDRRLRLGNLHIVNVSTADEGRYICLGDNTGKGIHNLPANRLINLKVRARSHEPLVLVDSALMPTTLLTAKQHERLTVSCIANAHNLRWLLNGNATITDAVRNAGNLTINRFDRNVHQGILQCVVENDASFESFQTAVLLRASEANADERVGLDTVSLISKKPLNVTVGLGHVALFACTVAHNALTDTSLQVYWLRNLEEVRNCDDNGINRMCTSVVNDNEHVLQVYSTQLDDAGKYTCGVQLSNRIELADAWLTVIKGSDADLYSAGDEQLGSLESSSSSISTSTSTSTSIGRLIEVNANANANTNTNRLTQLASIGLATQTSTMSTAIERAQSNKSNKQNEFSAPATALEEKRTEPSNALKSLADNALYLIALVACGVALLVCLSIVFVALLRKRRRRGVRRPAATCSFAKRIDFVPVGIMYNKLSQCDSTPLANSSRLPHVATPHAQVNPYASTPLPLCSASFPRDDQFGNQYTMNSSYLLPADSFSYASIPHHSTRPCSFLPEQPSSFDSDSCSDEDCDQAASPRKRVKYSVDLVNQLDLSCDTDSNFHSVNNSTLNRSKLTAVRKFSTVSSHRRSPAVHSPSDNFTNNTFSQIDCLRMSDALQNVDDDFSG